jgi:thioredoxin-like negative regulator of GroEL
MSLVFLAIAAFFAADMFLAKVERTESHVQAAHLFEQGRVLMQRGDNADAIKPIKDAIAIERGNRDYMRTLAQAQLTAGKTADAESTLTELLQSDSTDGLASLIMGRVLVKEGRFAEVGIRRRNCRDLLDNAAKALKGRVSAARQSEASESNLDLAERLWQARRRECAAPPATDSPLALVLARIAQ